MESFKDVYAIGDCSAVPELNLMYSAVQQGRYVATVLAKQAVAKPGAAPPKPYCPSPPFMLVSVGPKTGSAQLPTGQVASGNVVSLGKGRTLHTEEARRLLWA